MRIIVTLLALASAACASTKTPTITYRVVNDCYAETRKEVYIQLPNGKIELGVTCTVIPQIIVDTVKADTASKKK